MCLGTHREASKGPGALEMPAKLAPLDGMGEARVFQLPLSCALMPSSIHVPAWEPRPHGTHTADDRWPMPGSPQPCVGPRVT